MKAALWVVGITTVWLAVGCSDSPAAGTNRPSTPCVGPMCSDTSTAVDGGPSTEASCDPGACEEGFACPEDGMGACEPIACDPSACPEDTQCPSSGFGACEPIPCDPLLCPEDSQCPASGIGACEPVPCVPADCQPGTQCPASGVGACEPAPCDPAGCPEGTQCPASGLGLCEPIPPCTDNSECALTEICDQGSCVPRVATCTEASDCPPLMDCTAGVCVGCVDDLQCSLFSTGSQCVLGVCVAGEVPAGVDCIGAQCPSGERCNPGNGQCEPMCNDNSDCDAGQLCAPRLDLCVADPTCETDADCGTDLTCQTAQGSGICVGCNDTVACPRDLDCVFGACVPGTGGSSACDGISCPGGQLCDPLDGSCYPENGTCSSDDQCRPGQTCSVVGVCTGCSTDAECRPNQNCRFGACVPF